MEQIEITFNPNGVAGPAQLIATTTSHVVSECLRAFAERELGPPEGGTEGLWYRFNGPEMTPDERRMQYANWVLVKGFQDLARGVRTSLEEALFYLKLSSSLRSGQTTLGDVQVRITEARTRASRLHFPVLLNKVKVGLREPMAFEAEFLSIQRVRNCLEHRGGIVGQQDIDEQSGLLTLSFPRLKIFYMRGDEEVECQPGEVIDTHEPGVRNEDGVAIYLRCVTRTKHYPLGERIEISASDFFEMAMACHLFAGDLAAKLPTLPPIEEARKAVADSDAVAQDAHLSNEGATAPSIVG